MQIQTQKTLAVTKYDRVPSGIEGFDDLINGGLIPGRIYVVTGPSGAGKTIFGMHFLANGALHNHENGIFVTFDEEPQQLRLDMLSVGMNLDQLESDGQLVTLDASSPRVGIPSREKYSVPRPYTLDTLFFEIQKCVRTVNARRLVLDYIDAMELDSENRDEFRKTLIKLRFMLKSLGCTCLIVAESQGPPIHGRVEQFASDGVILLTYRMEECTETVIERNDRTESLLQDTSQFEVRSRKIEVLKMRGTSNSPYVHSFTISNSGLRVHPRPAPLAKTRTSTVEFKPIDTDSQDASARWYRPPSSRKFQ